MNESQAMTLNAAPAKATGDYEYPQPRSKALSSVQPATSRKVRVKVKPPAQDPEADKGSS